MDSSPLSPDDFRAAAEVYRELGPDFSEAVAQSFIDQVNREIVTRAAAQASRAQQSADVSKLHKHRPPVSGLASGAVVSAISLISVLILMHGSAAARADWYQWLLGALLVSVVVSAAVAAARKMQSTDDWPSKTSREETAEAAGPHVRARTAWTRSAGQWLPRPVSHAR
jgi:hypothetical protein